MPLLAMLLSLLEKLGIDWFNKTPPVVPLAEKLGQTEEALKDVEAGEQAVVDARRAADAVPVDPGSLRAPDPDSRD